MICDDCKYPISLMDWAVGYCTASRSSFHTVADTQQLVDDIHELGVGSEAETREQESQEESILQIASV